MSVSLQGLKTEYQKAGDVSLVSLDLVSHDGSKRENLFPLFQQVIINEDLFTHGMTGTVAIRDSVDIINWFPIIGEETLEFSYGVPGTEDTIINTKFRVHGLTTPTFLDNAQKVKLYMLSISSEEMITDTFRSVSRAVNAPTDTVIKQILTDDLGTDKLLDIAPTAGAYEAIIPGWEPFRTIRFLLRKSVSTDADDPSLFVFWEDRRGYHFDTIKNLVQKGNDNFNEEKHELRYRLNSATEEFRNDQLRRIERLELGGEVDNLAKSKLGAFTTKALSFDMLRKKHESFDYSYDTDYDGVIKTKSGRFKTSSDSFLTEVGDENGIELLLPRGENNNDIAPVSRYRVGFFNSMSAYEINARLPGSNNIFPGDVVNLTIPKSTGRVEGEAQQARSFIEDESLTGRYLVSAIRHEFFHLNYFMNIRLIRADSVRNLNAVIASDST